MSAPRTRRGTGGGGGARATRTAAAAATARDENAIMILLHSTGAAIEALLHAAPRTALTAVSAAASAMLATIAIDNDAFVTHQM